MHSLLNGRMLKLKNRHMFINRGRRREMIDLCRDIEGDKKRTVPVLIVCDSDPYRLIQIERELPRRSVNRGWWLGGKR